MKQRFSSLDVKVITHELSQTLPSLRISNIYDLSSRIFLFKCAKPGTKAQLLVDSGFRAHLTSFQRTANPTPSAFTSRLRKYLKTRRITGVSQLGTDRVIEITFSDGQYRLFLEFFAAGNIVLTDAELNVLALLRQVSEGNEDVDVKLGGKYVLEAKQNFNGIPALTQERVKDVLEKQVTKVKDALAVGGKKAKRNKGGNDLGKALSSGFSEYPSHLLEHAFIDVGLDGSVKPADVLEKEDLMKQVMLALQKADAILKDLGSNVESKGYIVAKGKEGVKDENTSPDIGRPPRDTLLYDDFHPFRPLQFSSIPGTHVLEFEGFNKTVDEFYSSIESQKLESRLTEREQTAKRKLESAKSEHEKRLGALQQVQELHVRKAQAIEANTHRVEEAAAAVNGLISQGMDWVDIGKLIENEQGRNNVVAQMIKLPLKLHENTVTLLLDEPGIGEESDSDEEDQTDSESDSDDDLTKAKSKTVTSDKRLAIDIDLGITPWANARQYYDQKKTAAVKQQRTVQASDKALKAMEHKTEADLKKGLKQEKAVLRPARKQFWFEKFLWFLSSDGYLVIGGKDAQQNEILYRRYLKKGDIYVHADLAGASSVIIKNNPTTPDAPIPPSTLSQAGALTVCTSSAWDSKAIMAAWWVKSDQVSKTAETGEYIKTGGFMIRGKKNFLPPTQLVLGFSPMWLISEESKMNHGKNRLLRTDSMLDGEAEALADDARGLSMQDDDETARRLPNNNGAVVDIEDAAHDAEKEIKEDKEAVDVSVAEEEDDDDDDDDDSDDAISTVASEAESPRNNPLQGNKESAGQEIADEDEQSDDEAQPRDADSDDNETQKTHEAGDDDEDSGDHDEEADSPQPDLKPTPKNSQQAQGQPKQSKVKRGANTKAKRAAAKKYALQSDEDRELAMSLLGSSKGAEKKAAAEEARLARETKSAADKERRRQQHEKAAQAEKEKQERLAKAEQNGETAVEEYEMDAEQIELERKEHMNIDLLVPYPQPGDELMAAVPVVAPWTALARNKYKVKLQPGSMKKGKAVKEIIGNWINLGTKGPKVVDETNQDKEKVWAREVDCFKAWRVEEIFGTVPVRGVRLMQSGGIMGGGGDKATKGKGTARGGKGGKKGGR